MHSLSKHNSLMSYSICFSFIHLKVGASVQSIRYYYYGGYYILVDDGGFHCVWNWRKNDKGVSYILWNTVVVRLVYISHGNATNVRIGFGKYTETSYRSRLWKHPLCARIFQIGKSFFSILRLNDKLKHWIISFSLLQ